MKLKVFQPINNNQELSLFVFTLDLMLSSFLLGMGEKLLFEGGGSISNIFKQKQQHS